MTVRRPPFALLLAAAGLLAVAFVGERAAWAAAGDNPVGKVVAEVKPRNNHAHPDAHILSQMHTRPGKPYDDAVAQADVQRLNATRWFAPGGVSVETEVTADGKVVVHVNVVELNNIVREVHFVGANHMSQTELLNLSGLRRGGPLNPAANRLAAQAIQNKYVEDGRYFATVELVEGDKLTDGRVVFNITEGPVVRIRGVSFKGNRQASGGRLRTQVTARGPLVGITNPLSPKFQPAQVEFDKQKLIDYYHRLGHLAARVREEVVPSADLASVELVYHVDEGPVYFVRAVHIDGNAVYAGERLNRLVELKADKPYDKELVATDTARIKTLYGNTGYQVIVDDQVFACADRPGYVDVHYKVIEPPPRPQAAGGPAPTRGDVRRVSHQFPGDGPRPIREPDRVGVIRIEGNTVTDQRVILNELSAAGIRSGQVLQYPALKVAENNLIRRQLFDMDDPPTVQEVQNDFDAITKDIVVRVKETRTGTFMVGGGINSNSGINGSVVLNERNFDILRPPTSIDDFVYGRAFRGGGQEFRLEAMPGNVFQRYVATWREPYLFDSDYGLTVSGYYSNQSYAEYNLDRYGGRFTLDRRFDPIWRANFSTRVEGVKVKDVPAWAPPAITDDIGNHFVLGLRGGLTRDSRDSYLFPTSGSILDFGVEQVLGDYQFPVGTAEYTKFFSSEYLQRRDGSGKHVLAVRSQLSVAGDNAPVFERFYAGGFRSLRGFTFRGVGPVENQLHVGGTFAFLNTVEYQVPVVASDKLFLVGFVDHGTVERDVSIRDYRVSVGFGVRFQVPAFGPVPIALDFAFPLTEGPGDIRQVFSFYFGLFGGQN